jgi:hypothetical protein
MRSILMVITNVVGHQAIQMPLIESDHVVEQIPAAVPDLPRCNTVLPRTSEAGPLGLDAEAVHSVDDFTIEVGAAIQDHMFRSQIVGECLAHFLINSRSGVVEIAPVKAPKSHNDQQGSDDAL